MKTPAETVVMWRLTKSGYELRMEVQIVDTVSPGVLLGWLWVKATADRGPGVVVDRAVYPIDGDGIEWAEGFRNSYAAAGWRDTEGDQR